MKMDHRPGRHAARPGVERLEGRWLLSPAPPRVGEARAARADVSGSGPSATAKREQFVATFWGSYVLGPGRRDGQALQTAIRGGGLSNKFLHGDLLIALSTPADPSSRVTGTATLFDKNFSTTSNILILDLEGDPPSGPPGRPTILRWTVNDSSSGAFTLAEGDGTLEIRYRSGPRAPRTLGSGVANVNFRGRLRGNPAVNPILL